MLRRRLIGKAVCQLVIVAILSYSSVLAQTRPATVDSARIVTQLGQLCNQVRLDKGFQPLARLEYLEQAAAKHSAEMSAKNYFGHQSPTQGQQTFRHRITNAGGFDPAMGENIYQCRGVPREQVAQRAMKAWLNSPTHRANLLNSNFNCVGFGVVCDGDTTTVTQNFAQQQVAVESLLTRRVSTGVEFVLKGQILSGASQGGVFVDKEFLGRFQARDDGSFEVTGVAAPGATIKICQKKTETRFSAALIIPAQAGICQGRAVDTARLEEL